MRNWFRSEEIRIGEASSLGESDCDLMSLTSLRDKAASQCPSEALYYSDSNQNCHDDLQPARCHYGRHD